MINKVLKIFYIVLSLILLYSFFNLKKLPEQSEIKSDLYQEPIQSNSTRLIDFNFNYKDKNYHVNPKADYELWGLVVSVNNIGAWYNMYHDKNSVNLKDICVIWGDNLKSDAYRQVKYKSGEWTCYYSWFGELDGEFRGDMLSNNHLFSDNAVVRNTIKNMNIGDQIHIKGTLSEYAEQGSDNYRGTSLDREDTGNGACETVFVTDAEIIQKRFPDWKIIWGISKNLLFITIIFHIILVIRSAKNITKSSF